MLVIGFGLGVEIACDDESMYIRELNEMDREKWIYIGPYTSARVDQIQSVLNTVRKFALSKEIMDT